MSSGVQLTKNGMVTGTGASLDVTSVGFRPRRVEIMNVEGLCLAKWQDSMPDASAVKQITDGTMTYITSLGITPLAGGFRIGADTDLNVSGEDIHWMAQE
jgi:hypothetical protein